MVAVDGRRLTRTADLADLISAATPATRSSSTSCATASAADVVGEARASARTSRRTTASPGSLVSPPVRALVRELALALREQVLPSLGSHAARAHDAEAAAAGGDVTFAIDAEAEAFLEAFLAERAPDVAFYSEDRGLVEPAGDARAVLVVDPIDGTRPALAGLESCCVSVAAAPLDPEPTMGDVTAACVVEIPSGQVFLAERGLRAGRGTAGAAVGEQRLDRMFWTYGFRGRPARALTEVIAELIDASSVGGGTFDLGSAAFDMTRVVTGQLDAYVEPGPRMVADVPGMRAGVRARGRRCRAQQLALRPGRSGAGAGGGRRRGHRRVRRLARGPAAAGLGRGVPDVGRRRRQLGAARAHPHAEIDEGIARLLG